ncbi:hypothetical protein BWI97_20550 [Siphonobacter sp. BAB-5405]|uniref:carboxypeptidase regulatory-like domain-containing protein n=1 Tax=Siphonobacter sp. BAB-5405 TaxID=1864825 RepID=UPI000C80C96C|nr:hypothetical protein BWI97_20550 [Siphonobacter sp. BAB-5405]
MSLKSTFFYLLLACLGTLVSCNEDLYIEPVQLTTIRGRVLYSPTQQPLGNATVRLTPGNRIVATDSSGLFRFDSVITGTYTIQASKTGYGTEVATVETSVRTSPLITLLLRNDQALNRPPSTPTLVAPAQNSTGQPNSLILRWKATDPNRDSLTYQVQLFRSGSVTPTATFANLKVDTLVLNGLDYNTTYLWQVVITDGTNSVNGPVWSFQTGTYPEFSYLFARRMNGQFQIFGATASGTETQLTRQGSNWRPIVSPNRQKVAFISNSATDLHLFVMNLDGSQRQQVTTVPIAGLLPTDLSFCWSPDGTQLLYPSNDRLYAVRTDGTGLRAVAQAGSGRVWAGCDWVSSRIVARSTGTSFYDNELQVMNADGSAPRMFYARRTARVGNPVLSITGQQVLFTADVADFQNEEGRQLDSRLHSFDLNRNTLTELSVVNLQTSKVAGTNDLDPRFSPNGASLIFTNTDNTGQGVRSVYTSDVNGANRKLILSQAEMPYWR